MVYEDGTVKSGDVISAGTYNMGGTVFVTLQTNLTIKGIGTTPNDVKLTGMRGDRGFDVEATGFHIENMWLYNTKGNGVEVKAKNTPENPNVFKKLFVNWAAGAVTENGRYSIYPTGCENSCSSTRRFATKPASPTTTRPTTKAFSPRRDRGLLVLQQPPELRDLVVSGLPARAWAGSTPVIEIGLRQAQPPSSRAVFRASRLQLCR